MQRAALIQPGLSTADSLLTLWTAQQSYVHLAEANDIDAFGDWSDAARFPEKYAVWSQQMPQRAVRRIQGNR